MSAIICNCKSIYGCAAATIAAMAALVMHATASAHGGVAVIRTKRFGALALVAGLTLAVLSPSAMAQKAPDAAAKPATNAAPAAQQAAPAKAEVKKVASVCKGLDEASCGKNTICTWRAAATRKDGVAVKAHCRKKPDISKAQAAKDAKKAAKEAAPPATQAAPPATQAAPAAKKVPKSAPAN